MASPLLLGPVAFDGFEVPGRLGFGGAQRLAVHRLPGGGRVVDALGRDDADLGWSGVFAGPDAAERARMLDALRVAGGPLTLSWDAFLYTVVIARFEASYASPWWIPYRIVCTVLRDEASAVVQAAGALLDGVLADVGVAAGGVDVSAVQTALAVSGAAVAGSAAQAAALAALGSVQATVQADMDAAGAALMAAADLPSAAAAAGQLAQLADARGYVARAQVNLANASN